MGGSRTQSNKPHKSRFSSKSSRNLHKTSANDKGRIAKSDRKGAKTPRAARLNRNKMLREQKKATILKERRASSPSVCPPRVIVLFGLSASVDVDSLADDMITLLCKEEDTCIFSCTVASSEYKLRTTILKAPYGDLLTCIEMAKVADLLAFVTSTSSAYSIDPFSAQCLSVFRSIGLPSTIVFLRDLPIDVKKRNEAKKLCSSTLAGEFSEECKFYPADNKDDLHKFLWLFKEQRITVPHWRSQRPYLMCDKVEMVSSDTNAEKCTLLLTGYVRARSLSANQLVHISGVGDFQLQKIEILNDPCPLHARKKLNAMDADLPSVEEVVRAIDTNPLLEEPLLVENIPDPLVGEQTWPTDAEIAEAVKLRNKGKKKRMIPPGTSEYQAAWIVDESDVEASASSSDVDDGMVLDTAEVHYPGSNSLNIPDFEDDEASLNLRDSDEETENESMLMDGENMTREQIEDEIKKIKEAHADDEDFPDEVETPFDIPARQRFVKYRGLKSFRTSAWDPKESLPQDYAKIFAFDNFEKTQKYVLSKQAQREEENGDDCISAGQYVRIHVRDVPLSSASDLYSRSRMRPIIACGLLQHESKMSVLHFSVKKYDAYDAPIKSKEELLFHVGFRQFVVRPIFSSDNINSNKHKMERFLHSGRFSVASVYAPISFPSVPLVVLKENGDDAVVAAIGSLRSIDPDRIILKKIILTGYPQRVSKLKVSVRYMFHHPEDVRWFKPVELWTKCGRRGRIKEPVGTHGTMKCVFNGVVQQHDTVCMSLYKRAFPKWTERKFPLFDKRALGG